MGDRNDEMCSRHEQELAEYCADQTCDNKKYDAMAKESFVFDLLDDIVSQGRQIRVDEDDEQNRR